MTATKAIFRRELRGYFGTPVAYVFLVVFVALAAVLAFRDGFYTAREATLTAFFQFMPWLFALLAPAIAMRTWAEERRSGTIELLFTLPVTIREAVVGKFLAGWAFFGIALLLTFGMVFTVAWLGEPDNGPIFTGYVGAFLLAGGYLAIGTFFSAMSKNQVIAFILGAIACGFFVYVGTPSLSQHLPLGLAEFFGSLSFLSYYDVMQLGILEFRGFFFTFAIIVAFLASSTIILQENKAR